MTNEQKTLDTRALEVAMEARTKIDSHEELCALRYAGIENTMKNIMKGQDGLYSRFWAMAVGVISVLLTSIFFMLKYMVN